MTDIDALLIEALDRYAAGEAIDVILDDYPTERERLSRTLRTVQALEALEPSDTARARSEGQFLQQAQTQRRQMAFRRVAASGLAVAALFVMLLCGLVGIGGAVASQAALPGDALYPVKRTLEDVQTAFDPGAQERFEAERVEEVQALIAAGRTEAVAFSGMVQAVEGRTLTVAGIEVQVPESIASEEALTRAEGGRAEVEGITGSGEVVASAITIEAPEGPVTVPTATLSPTVPPPTDTPPPTETPLPSPSSTPTVMVVPPTATVPPPTVIVVPPTPEPPSGGDGSTDDGGDDGSSDDASEDGDDDDGDDGGDDDDDDGDDD